MALSIYLNMCFRKKFNLRGLDDTEIYVVDIPIYLSGHLIGNILECTLRCLSGGHRLDGVLGAGDYLFALMYSPINLPILLSMAGFVFVSSFKTSYFLVTWPAM